MKRMIETKFYIVFVVLTALSLFAWGCGDSGSTSNQHDGGDEDWAIEYEIDDAPEYDPNAPGIIATTPDDTIDFGAVQIFQTVTAELIIRNIGSGILHINTIFINGTDEFSIPEFANGTAQFDIYPGGMKSITIQYQPQNPGPDSAMLQIASNAQNAPLKNIQLTSLYKGTSKLKFFRPCGVNEPDCIGDWAEITEGDSGELYYGIGNTPAGSVIEGDIQICNMPDEVVDNNKAIKITSITKGRSTNETQAVFDLTPEREVSRDNPVYLTPGDTIDTSSCLKVHVTYSPYEATFAPETHYTHMRVEHNADEPAESPIEVLIEGTASESALMVQPQPIDFGETEFFNPKTITVTISNPTSGAVTINDINIQQNEQVFSWQFTGTETLPLVLNGLEQLVINTTFEPLEEKRYGAYLRIFTNIPGAETVKVRMSGIGKAPNLPPVSRIALSAHGADITMPIVTETCTGPQCNTLTFFGDISYDPDRSDWSTNGITHYYWHFEKPNDSYMKVWCSCDPAHNPPPSCAQGEYDAGDVFCDAPLLSFSSGIDRQGEYKISLMVEDEDGAQSATKQIMVRTYGSDIISIQMDFTCSGTRMDVDLQWIAPNGIVCDMRHMNSQRTCDFGGYGLPVVSEFTEGCGVGRSEAITHENAPDGTYRVKVRFVENCKIDSPLNIPIIDCLWDDDTDVNIKFYINGQVQWTRSVHMTEKGEEHEWTIEKAGGVFREPSP